jgi:ubiquinone/menaquinone biosynthesis C-methylase UbiE
MPSVTWMILSRGYSWVVEDVSVDLLDDTQDINKNVFQIIEVPLRDKDWWVLVVYSIVQYLSILFVFLCMGFCWHVYCFSGVHGYYMGITMYNVWCVMADLFSDKSQEWDVNPVIAKLSSALGSAMKENVVFQSSDTVMDFGAGTGLIASAIAPLVDKIVAVDVSPSMLEELQKKPVLQGKVEVVCQDITQAPLQLTKPVDAIVSAMAFHHVENTALCLERLAGMLKDGGTLAVADLDTEDGSFHPPGMEGVYHSGFDRSALGALAEKAGFRQVAFTTAHVVEKEKNYPVFLLTAKK